MRFRILIAGVFHEGNQFSSVLTRRANFVITEGAALVEKARGSSAAIGGAVRALAGQPVDILPAFSAVTPPGGPVEDAVYENLRDRILAAARELRPDGIYLDLHGGMVTQSLVDPEGDLLERLRAAVGASVPIAVSLDLHAYLTDRMLAHADIIVACKENPHSDYDQAGERAALLLVRMMQGRIRPVTAAQLVPLIIGSQMETGSGPLKLLHDKRRALMQTDPRLLDISIYNVHTLLDGEHAGQCITVMTDGDATLAAETAAALGRDFWERRDAFVPDLASLDSILTELGAGHWPKPLVVGDQGDRVLAGTPGDGTFIIRALLQDHPRLRAVVPLTDPETVDAARHAGIGAVLHRAIGGRLSIGETPVEGDWRVLGLGDGNFVQAGPFLAGEPAQLGDTAILARGNVTVLVTSLPGFTQDPVAFSSQGIELRDFDLVVAKSGHHFRLSFAGIGPCLVADTPGIANYRPGLIAYKKRRPAYPEDQNVVPRFEPALYRRDSSPVGVAR